MALLNKHGVSAMRSVAQQTRGMATEKQILMRITATKNIAKITKSMKMVSAAKMRGAENRMTGGRPFSVWLDNIQANVRTIEKDGVIPAEDLKDDKHLFVPITSDRGLCGGCNSFVAKSIRQQTEEAPGSDLFVIGDKGRGQLRRTHGETINGHITECWASPVNFAVASSVAEVIGATTDKDAKVHVVFNKFVSAIAYQQTIRSLNISEDSEVLAEYELESDTKEDLVADLKEFQLASAIFHGMIEANTSEESARMAAMENATKNAEELVSDLTLVYNKARQARITTELIEIISGASSLDG